MAKQLTTTQFFRLFPDDETCLTHLFNVRFGEDFECLKCGRAGGWHRIKAERAYSCQWCGHHLHPTVGTPFEQTRTPLQLWFYAIHLFTTTRHGVSAKELERQLGVTYKTAWRMATLIRQHMADVDHSNGVGGEGIIVEIDETLVGGSVSGKGSGYKGNKTCVVGMLERDGELVTRVVSGRTKAAMRSLINAHILPGTTVNTDEFGGYKDLGLNGFRHVTVNHAAKQYATVSGGGVNAIEGFWAALKRGINGTHIHVSGKHLPKYLGEFEYRWNMRHVPHLMLSRLMLSFQR